MFHQASGSPLVDGGGWIIVPGLGPVWVPPWRPDQFSAAGRLTQLLAAVGAAIDRMPSELATIQQHARDLIKEAGQPKRGKARRGVEAQLELTQRLLERPEARRAIERVASQVAPPAVAAGASPWRMDPNPDEENEGGGVSATPLIGSIVAFLVIAILLSGIFG